MNKLKLSIITITYNNPNLKRTLDSILIQENNFLDIEHIIVDNLSNDNTESLVKEYIKKAKYQVIYIREKDNGRYDGMNKGIKVSKGEYLLFMNAGDHFFNNISIKEIIDNCSNFDIVYGNLNVVGEERSSVYSPPDFLDFKYFLSSALPHQASAIKRELFYKIGFYDDSIKISSDWEFFLLAICKFKCSYFHLNKIISTYYLDGISSKPENFQIIEKEKISIFNNYFSKINTLKINTFNKNEQNFKTPILFLIFNRLDLTKEVFNQIKNIKPAKFFIVSDGAREDKIGEEEIIKEIRSFILDNTNWNCEIKTLFREVNFGCGHNVSKAISWFFDNVEEGIILEDDCVPDKSFFPFCEELLEKYRNDNRISHINGTSFVNNINSEYSFYYSKYFHVWGWATWRRAWNKYDFYMKNFSKFQSSGQIKNMFWNKEIQDFWISCFNFIFIDKKDTWDYQWVYTNFINNQLSIMPFTNLVKNIGFGERATHTTNQNDKNANREIGSIVKIDYPLFMVHNYILDNIIYSKHLGLPIDNATRRNNLIFGQLSFKKYILFFIKKSISKFSRTFIYKKFKKPLKKIYYLLRLNKI